MEPDSIIFAFDRTSRRIDADGRLHVAMTNISKSVVNPYYGREIPGYQELGLDGGKIYQMLRHPDELAKSAASFNNIQLLSRHQPVSASDNPEKLVVGSTGTDGIFNKPYLQNSLVVWDAAEIAGIESEDKCQLSASYRYVPVMEPGEYEGKAYDGVMTNIIGNHVALVEIGRAGSDVVVADENPFKEQRMKTKKELLADLLKPFLAADAAPDLDAILALAKDEKDEPDDDDKIKDGENEEEYKARMAKKKPAMDIEKPKEEPKPEVTKAAMDEAIKLAEDSTIKKMRDIQTAEKVVAPIVGEIAAMDSAKEVYKLALDAMSVNVEGVDPSAYGAMVKLAIAGMTKKPALVAQDSGLAAKLFPEAITLKRC